MKPFGEQLAAWRAERGLSQRALADAVSMPHSTLGSIETGRLHPSRATTAMLADALGRDPAEVWACCAWSALRSREPEIAEWVESDGLVAEAKAAMERAQAAESTLRARINSAMRLLSGEVAR
jgi:transcriptional regulator with XRE-family HTH domain